MKDLALCSVFILFAGYYLRQVRNIVDFRFKFVTLIPLIIPLVGKLLLPRARVDSQALDRHNEHSRSCDGLHQEPRACTQFVLLGEQHQSHQLDCSLRLHL